MQYLRLFMALAITVLAVLTPGLTSKTSDFSLGPSKAEAASYPTLYSDDFSTYPVGEPPMGWTEYGSQYVVPTIEEVGGVGPEYRLLNFPTSYPTTMQEKYLVKDGLEFEIGLLVTKINFQHERDEAGLVLAYNDPANHIRVTANAFWNDMTIWEVVGGELRTVVGTGRGNLPIVPLTDYWLKVEVVAGSPGVGNTLIAYWSTDGNNFTPLLTVSNLANSRGGVGYITWSAVPPHVHFDDFMVRAEPTGKRLEVPLRRSTWSPWNDDVYDQADRQSLSCGRHIENCGCALTSITMVLLYHEVTKAPDGSPTNPDTLNNYFRLDAAPATCERETESGEVVMWEGWKSRGYYCGGVIWPAAVDYSVRASESFGTPSITSDESSYVDGHAPELYRQDIDNDTPVIIQVRHPDPHWVVVTGYVGDTFWINDPGFDRDRLDHPQLSNTSLAYRRYRRASSDFSSIAVATSAPDHVLITDENGNRTGFDPVTWTVVKEIPNSTYFFEQGIADATGVNPPPPAGAGIHVAIVTTPQAGSYSIDVISVSNDTYGFGVYAYDREANLAMTGFDGQVAPGAQPRYTLTYDPTPGATTVSLQVPIDIKPASYPNSINMGSKGIIPVAILSSEIFDATQVDPDTVALAGAGVAVRGKGSKLMAHEEDVNEDGLLDLVIQVDTENLDPAEFQDGTAVLTGQTFAGQLIEGQDEIVIVPPG